MPLALIDHETRPGRVSIQTQYVDRHLVRQLPGVAYDGRAKVWHAPLSWGTCVTLRGLFGAELTIDDTLANWAWQERVDRVDPCLLLRDRVDPEWADDGNDDLYPFQRVGVRFLATAGRALLTDEPGSGKTVQVVRAMRDLHEHRDREVFPALVVCPNGIKYVWEREFKRWWPGVRVQVVTGGAAGRRKALATEADVYVVNYDAIKLHSRLAPYGSIALRRCEVCEPELCAGEPQSRCEWCLKELNHAGYRTVIVDEAHRIKSPSTRWTRAVWAIGHGPTVRYRFALTGTPVASNPADLWAVMHFVAPDEFPTRVGFIDRYVEKSYNFFGGHEFLGLRADTRDELFRILDPRMRRLPKSIVLPQLPEKIYSVRYLEMSAKQARAYRQMEDYMAAHLEDELLVAKDARVKVGRLLQFAAAYAQIDDDGQVQLTDPSNKIDALIELIDELGGKPLVVASPSRRLIELAGRRLERELGPDGYRYVTGAVPLDERQSNVDAFQAGKVRVLLCTVDAAGEGLTMTRADTMVFLSRHWSAIKNSQMEDRIHRVGSEVHDSVEIIDLVSINTWEERQRDVLDGKLERLQEVVRDRETLLKLLGR